VKAGSGTPSPPYPAAIPIRLLHLLFAALAATVLWRATAQAWLTATAPEEPVAAALRAALPLLSLGGSLLAMALGRARPWRAFALDAASLGLVFLDRFGTKLEKRYRRDEVIGLLERAGLEDIRVSERPPYWHAVGRRPTVAVLDDPAEVESARAR